MQFIFVIVLTSMLLALSSLSIIYFIPSINSEIIMTVLAQSLSPPKDDKSPSFLEAYWTNTNIQSSQQLNIGNPVKVEVAPGNGPSTLAVILVNTGRSDITGLTGNLILPEEFRSIKGENNIISEHVSVASYNSVVKPGESFPLYFTIEVLDNAKVGPYEGVLILFYSKVLEVGQIYTNITIPFRVTGKSILEVISPEQKLYTNFPNEVQIFINNIGSAKANEVIATITDVTGGTAILRNDTDKADMSKKGEENNAFFNVPNSNLTENLIDNRSANNSKFVNNGKIPSIQGNKFYIGQILPNDSAVTNPIIYPDYSSGGSIQMMNLEISYNDAYGNEKILNTSIGLIINPNPPESVLTLSPGSMNLNSNFTSNLLFNDLGSQNFSNPAENYITLKADTIQKLDLIISNNGKEYLKDVVFSLESQSESVKILGESRWTFNLMDPFSQKKLSTLVYASEDVISKPVSFILDAEYISAGKSRNDSLNIGIYVDGTIKIRVYDLSIENIGGIPNLIGNLLNEGNTVALFTTIELINPLDITNNQLLNSSANNKVENLPLKSLPARQYLGDLTENSPLPFSIPIELESNTKAGVYLTSLKVVYKDHLREEHTNILNERVNYVPINNVNTNNASSEILNFNSNRLMLSGIIIVVVVIITVVSIVLIKRQRRKKSKFYDLLKENNDSKDFMNEDQD